MTIYPKELKKKLGLDAPPPVEGSYESRIAEYRDKQLMDFIEDATGCSKKKKKAKKPEEKKVSSDIWKEVARLNDPPGSGGRFKSPSNDLELTKEDVIRISNERWEKQKKPVITGPNRQKLKNSQRKG